MSRFQPPRYRPEPTKPRRVRGGVKLSRTLEEIASSWASARWLRLIEDAASGDTITQGLEYARAGQARNLDVRAGEVSGAIQGRRARAYGTSIRMTPLDDGTWSRVEEELLESSTHVARLAAGELPPNVEDVFAPVGARLFPASHQDLDIHCDCGKEDGAWCKHAVALAYLFSQHLHADPLLMLTLRGCPIEELTERLRSRRAVAGQSDAIPVYAPHLPEIADLALRMTEAPLERRLEDFWDDPDASAEFDAPITPAEVSHPLLRRLGQSPFSEGKFPLVGLLATCYDVISQDVRREETETHDEESADSSSLGDDIAADDAA